MILSRTYLMSKLPETNETVDILSYERLGGLTNASEMIAESIGHI